MKVPEIDILQMMEGDKYVLVSVKTEGDPISVYICENTEDLTSRGLDQKIRDCLMSCKALANDNFELRSPLQLIFSRYAKVYRVDEAKKKTNPTTSTTARVRRPSVGTVGGEGASDL